jgi:urease accessory protein
MHSAVYHRPKGLWPDGQAEGSITLDFDARHRRRVKLVTDGGEEVLLDLPKAVAMADGDGLRLGDGRWLRVRAALEAVVEVRHGDPHQFARLAWHLGNRHLPTEIRADALVIRPDHVIEDMLTHFGAKLTKRDAPFQPEGGAYGGHAQGGHGHSHNHGHNHDHGDDHHHNEHDH